MTHFRTLFPCLCLLLGLGACGSDGDPPSTTGPIQSGRDLPCRVDFCGEPRVRAAVPTRDLVRIDFAASRSKDANGLEAYSSYHGATLAHIEEMNAVIDAAFDELEMVAGLEPVVEGEDHLWRTLAGETDVILDLDAEGANRFSLAFYEGDPGFTPTDPIIAGTVTVSDDGLGVEALSLQIDVGELAAVEGIQAEGRIEIEATPFSSGLKQVTFDTVGLSYEDDPVEDSETTYWIFGEDDCALTFLIDVEDVEHTTFVRWDARGGRWDSHSSYDDPHGDGVLDDIVTNCWDATQAEVFAAEATIDEDMNFEGSLAGEEADCLFGPIADHPAAGDTYADLPAQGEWATIDFVGCEPATQSCACDADQPCREGFMCADNVCLPIEDEGCERDEDCAEGEICEAMMCVPEGCEFDEDCAEGEYCDADGYCQIDGE